MIRALTPFAPVSTTASTGVPSGSLPNGSRRAVAAFADPATAPAQIIATILALHFIARPLAASKHPHRRLPLDRPDQPIAQWQPERICLDLELVTLLRAYAVAEGERGGAEEVDVNVSRPAELGIFELMIFE